jgi:hypothetical protein
MSSAAPLMQTFMQLTSHAGQGTRPVRVLMSGSVRPRGG